MKDLSRTLKEITEITLEIETNYPELYRYLEENPLTIPINPQPYLDKEVMKEYLEGLQELLKHHLETHKTSNN